MSLFHFCANNHFVSVLFSSCVSDPRLIIYGCVLFKKTTALVTVIYCFHGDDAFKSHFYELPHNVESRKSWKYICWGRWLCDDVRALQDLLNLAQFTGDKNTDVNVLTKWLATTSRWWIVRLTLGFFTKCPQHKNANTGRTRLIRSST